MPETTADEGGGLMWKAYHREIDQRLDELRPERVGAGEKEWREPVYGWARNHIPDESNIVHHFAEQIVDRREGQATKRGNEHLRRWMHGQMPLTWADLGPLPIRVGKLRIRLDAATPEDLDDAAGEVQADGARTWQEVLLLAETMREIAKLARRAGLATVAKVGDLPPHESDEAAA